MNFSSMFSSSSPYPKGIQPSLVGREGAPPCLGKVVAPYLNGLSTEPLFEREAHERAVELEREAPVDRASI